jgi:iron complex outermembrane recepter protein
VFERGRSDVHEAGGSAGTVRVERNVPVFAKPGIIGRVGGTVAGQGTMREGWTDVSAGGAAGGLRAIVSAGAAGDYENGDGTVIPSSWRQQQATLVGAWRPIEGQELHAGGSVVRGSDMRYAGASMDAPQSDLELGRVGYDGDLGDWQLSSRAFVSRVDHVMDNYSLRTWTAPMAMRAVSSADVLGGRIDGSCTAGDLQPAVGMDLEVQRLAARRTRAMDPTAPTVLESVLWPDVELARLGGYAELTGQIGAWRLQAGLRLDVVDSSAGALDEDPVGGQRSPRQLYQLYYGQDGGDRREWLPGAVLGLERALGSDGRLSLSLGRTMRAADTTERYIAANSSMASGRWIGNPELDAEAHCQARLQADWTRSRELEAGLTAFADRVQDHILRDRARNQDGIQQGDGATIYRNTQAMYLGSGAHADWRLHRLVSVAGNIDQVWAKDLDSGLPLAQIPPLAGSATLRGHGLEERLTAAATLRWAARQTRVDDDVTTGSGLDPGEGPGWAVLDLSISWDQVGLGTMAVGCDNVFDRTYAEHLAKPGTFDPTVSRVDEPGRNLWVSAVWRF